jgi:hypothetical protein
MMMAMQQSGMASGGQIDENALTHARALLYRCVKACGGGVTDDEPSGGSQRFSVLTRARGGKLDVKDEAARLLALWDRTREANPGIRNDKILSYMCQKAPGIARLFKQMLSEGFNSRDACAAMIRALARWADGQ